MIFKKKLDRGGVFVIFVKIYLRLLCKNLLYSSLICSSKITWIYEENFT